MTAKLWRCLCLLAAAGMLLPIAPSNRALVAEAAPLRGGISNVVPFLGVLVGWHHRNKVYRDANQFIAERNAYYDQLRDTAGRQLIEREIGGLRTSQVAAYTKLVQMIEQGRSAELAVAESLKRETRAAFNDRLQSAILQRILGTEAIQRVLGAMVNGVDRGQGLIDAALGKLAGQGGGILAEVENIRSTARDVETVASAVGGRPGQGLRGAASRVAQTIERPRDVIRADLEKVQGDLTQLGDMLGTLRAAGRAPSAGALATELVIRPPGGSGDPAAQAVAILVSRLGVGNPNLKEQAQAAIQAGFVARCTALVTAYRQALARLNTGEVSDAQLFARCSAIDVDELVRTARPTQEAAGTAEGVAGEPEEPTATDEGPPLGETCSLTGEGDFVIENFVLDSVSNNCEDSAYPFGMPAEPLLLYLAAAGRWVIVSDTPEATTWAWQPTMDLEGANIEGNAQTDGSTLVIDTSLTVPPSGTSFAPLPSRGNGLALAVILPLFPLAIGLSSRKRRRLALLTLSALALLLMAQSCDVYGSFSGHYTFPIPQEGFACEVPPGNTNLAEMPGSSGQVSMELTVADENSTDTCSISASVTGLGILKQDGFYTQESLQLSE
jgi:hypothetical protein